MVSGISIRRRQPPETAVAIFARYLMGDTSIVTQIGT